MTKLYLAASQTENADLRPYLFPMTGIRVFSLEEAMYHCFHHWRQSVDFLGEPFIRWVESDLGLGEIGAKLRKIEAMEGFAARFLAFLAVTDYFPKENLAALAKELGKWERRQTWEKLAEQGDYWIRRGEGERAFALYNKALNHQEVPSVKLLNNCGVALMHMGNFDNAAAHFARALRAAVGEELHFTLCCNLIEAQIYAGDFEEAQAHIEEAAADAQEHHELYYFQGEINFYQKNYFEATKLYEKALSLFYDPEYIYKLCDCYMRIRLYDKALTTIQTVVVQDIYFLRKQAGYFAMAQNIPMAIKSIEKALLTHGSDPELLITLAGYHRQDYDLMKASAAISRALNFAPDNPAALLEQARIRKAQGRTKEYQGILNRILAAFKRNYREQKRLDARD